MINCDFKESFLKNSQNKENLNNFLALKLLEFYQGYNSLTITKGDTIETNDESLLADSSINVCLGEEADQRLVRQVIQCVTKGIKNVVIRTFNTDVLLLLIAYRYAESFDSNIYTYVGAGKCKYSYDILLKLGEHVCPALHFFQYILRM